MGQESSSMVDGSTRPETLKARTIEAVASYIKSGKAKKIVVMTGAGISTSAGIPDFRSPTTGLYANLARLNLPYPEAVFEISFFRENPMPFYALAHELYPGKYHPTIAHSFIKLLYDKELLLMAFTQNIDCLEREAGVPDEKIVEAHGSFARQRCIVCKTEYPDEAMQQKIKDKEVPHCVVPQCNGLVKPDIVFFGEALPDRFFHTRHITGTADLAIVMGTSLSVQPFAGLPSTCREETPRVLINQDKVGGLGGRADDVLLLGDCDEGVRKFADALGWREELEALWRETQPEGTQPYVVPKVPEDKDEALAQEIDKLTADVDKGLKVSSEHSEKVQSELSSENRPQGMLDGVPAKPPKDPSLEELMSWVINKTEKSDDAGLEHVFPHINKKPSL